MEEKIWIDAELISDPDSAEELGSSLPVLTDAEVRGSRLVLALRSVTAVAPESGDTVGVAELACTFHPALGTRFISATLALALTQPIDARFHDIEPKMIQTSDPIRFVVDDKGKLAITLGKTTASGEIDLGQKREYTRYHCLIRGSGAGTARAQWTFTEDPTRRDGIGVDHTLILTTIPTGTLTGYLQVSARLARDMGDTDSTSGVLGALGDLILRPQGIERRLGFQLPIPLKPLEDSSSRFRHLDLS